MQTYAQKHIHDIIVISIATITICLSVAINQRNVGGGVLLGLQFCLLISTFFAEKWDTAAWRLGLAFVMAILAITLKHVR